VSRRKDTDGPDSLEELDLPEDALGVDEVLRKGTGRQGTSSFKSQAGTSYAHVVQAFSRRAGRHTWNTREMRLMATLRPVMVSSAAATSP
jgi:hypothetical protein